MDIVPSGPVMMPNRKDVVMAKFRPEMDLTESLLVDD